MIVCSASAGDDEHRTKDQGVEDLCDEDLALAISHLNGSPSEFERLFQLLWRRVEASVAQNVRSMICSHPYGKDELVNEVREKVRGRIHQYQKRSGASFRSWVYRVTVNSVFNWLRHEKRTTLMSQMDEWTIDTVFGSVPSPQEDYINKETRSRVREAVERLPSTQRQVVKLMDYEGMSVKDVACRLRITESLVKTTHYRAKLHLQHILRSKDS